MRAAVARHLLGLFASLALGSACAHACPTAGEEATKVATVESRLELRLADGRLVRLAGVDPALPTPDRPDLDETVRAQLAARIAGKTVSLHLLTKAPDRWGRRPAMLFEDGAGDGGGLAATVIAAGLGRYLAEPTAHTCRDALLAAEKTARQAKLGLWADPYYGVLAFDDRAAFVERSGTLVLAEGRLRAVEPSPYRTTLRFAAQGPVSHGGRMLVATVLPRTMKTFRAEHMDFGALIGRRLRLRGLLDLRFGPRIELAGPDAVEILDPPGDGADPSRPN